MKENNNLIQIPKGKSFYKKLMAFIGPAYLVSVGYMDPGNWATDIAGGSKFGYELIWVILISNIMAIFFQTLCARLGIVTGNDLAQACRSHYNKAVNYVLWILCEIAIVSTDIAEVLGTAIGLNLIFNLPLIYGVIITGFDTLLLLFLDRFGIRKMEAFIIGLIAIIGISFFVEIVISKPDYHGIVLGFIPSLPNEDALFIAIGIIGATIMPHNLYLHSSIVQTRNIERTEDGLKQAVKFNNIDSLVALNIAFLVNAAILILAASVFHRSGNYGVDDILKAHKLLEPVLGSTLAPILFGVALIAAGQSSTVTGTYAGQIVMEGFIHLRVQPWVRRLITRILAIIPSILTIMYFGDSATGELLIISQVILSLQLAFALIPLIHFVSSKNLMKDFVISKKSQILAWLLSTLIIYLNVRLVIETLTEWMSKSYSKPAEYLSVTICILLGILLIYIILEPIIHKTGDRDASDIHGDILFPEIDKIEPYNNIALALDFSRNDRDILSQAVNFCSKDSNLILIHIVESVSASIYGKKADDIESKKDIERINMYVKKLKSLGFQNVISEIGYGKAEKSLVQIVEKHRADLIIFGTHGHHGILDILFGTITDKIKHKLSIPILIAK
ncbi:Nramp family divalent metal transporter [Clostridium luticellarii]|jgi:manganese transport protein|uniref:Divalent metal cation transporter MntH n=1 Tax=Clostridium luticellarii TaxID=1691940 RepID=A0A2T0BPJ2_9CLOT|nr:Nramp family divalent metal transporter [Clostridium luticellarii]MCI1944193.1 Nramp family divalent metal transporter [Clostridium luticellarii]MCI1967695.1 Nramp family divalent metal transporter [Clostridium luticellarii]MCI1994856.1 Nramp family divalent metal transporter [Clostridium luticellarii]MCI2039659.1 Nramp family divalent metal transporter [Clostridium luticellarii]PRR85806.1 Divalent metal cation transporter MntH [Clostridium luticellarii]